MNGRLNNLRKRRKLPSSMSARLVRALTLMQSGRKLLSTERKMLKRVRRKRKKRLSIFNAPTDRKRSLTSISPLLMSLVEVAAEVVAEDAEVVDVTAVTDLIVEIVTVRSWWSSPSWWTSRWRPWRRRSWTSWWRRKERVPAEQHGEGLPYSWLSQ